MRLRRIAAAAGLALLVGACAPHQVPPPQIDLSTRMQRFDRACQARQRLGAGLDADLVLRISGDAVGELPALNATLALAGPDAARVRVQSAFGTALDVAARGDSLTAFVPSRRVVLDLVAASDTLGVPIPGPLAYRLWSATWLPPREAWQTAIPEDSLMVLRWSESGDSLTLGVGASGLPRRLAWQHAGESRVVCDYPGWSWVQNTAWPTHVEFEDESGALRVDCRLSLLRPSRSSSRARFGVRLPAGVERVAWSTMRRWIEQWGGM